MGRFASLVCAIAVSSYAITAVALGVSETGTGHADRLLGTKGADELKGLRGHDLLIGGRGRDVLIGGRGPDTLRGGPGRDSFNMRDGAQLGARGRDKIDARDGGRDEINCGAGGKDVAIVDASEDGVFDCELVKEPAPEAVP